MTDKQKDFFVVGALILCLTIAMLSKSKASAMEQIASGTSTGTTADEVKPYVFAELPHGRIYKAVHQGCELFISESDYFYAGGVMNQHQYTIVTGRGCH
jgi:hypothetical protein